MCDKSRNHWPTNKLVKPSAPPLSAFYESFQANADSGYNLDINFDDQLPTPKHEGQANVNDKWN